MTAWHNKIIVVFFTISFLSVNNTSGWDKDEHHQLGDSVFTTITQYSSLVIPKTIKGDSTFGELSAGFIKDVHADYRFHQRNKTILDQLSKLSADDINIIARSDSFTFNTNNVITAYLTSHIRAMKQAEQLVKSQEDILVSLQTALCEEAYAQSFLADAFSAGHILSYNNAFLSSLQKRNKIEAHNFHRNQGVYVINSRGDVWQTFGDGILHWYKPTYEKVFEACYTSLNEFMIVFYISAGLELPEELSDWLNSVLPGISPVDAVALWLADHDGAAMYEEVRLPSLMLLPIPVVASWSYRTQETDEYGIRRHHHYPQLRDDCFHDPNLSKVDDNFLYPESSVPNWMIPEPFRKSPSVDPNLLIKSYPDWSSVQWIQERFAPPSYKGLLLHLGGQVMYSSQPTHLKSTFAIGYGFWDDLLLVKNVSVSLALVPFAEEKNHPLIVPSGGFGIDLPGENRFKALRIDGGIAIDPGRSARNVGAVFSIGIDTKVYPLKFTNAGITCRIKYQWFYLDNPFEGPALELILQ